MIRRLMRKFNNKDESGIALVSVIAVGAVLAILAVTGVAYSVGSYTKARDDQDWNGALAAAYAGVEEYQSRLANNPAYVRFGNAASTYTSYVNPLDPTDQSGMSKVSTPVVANPAFGVGETGTWANVPGSKPAVAGSTASAQYRYEVNNARYDSEGVLTLRVTGRVGQETRSIVADLKQDGFVNYVYFTDLETRDPYNVSSTCYRYAWGNPARPSSCGEIQFGASDILDGAVHSNDTMVMCGAEFKAQVTTEYNPANIKYKVASGCAQPKLNGLTVKFSEHIEMPPTNNELKKETRYDLTATDVPNPGCLYTGPTSIEFKDNGTMIVKSPWTKVTQVNGAEPTEGRNLMVNGKYYCGNPTDLASDTGAIVDVPDNNLIYVQDVPAIRSGTQNPNYTAKTSPPRATATTNPVRCDGIYVRTRVNGKNVDTWNPPNNGLGYPLAAENYAKESNAPANVYKCQAGDLFVKGKVDGKVTVAAQNFVYVVGDLSYESTTDDVLGLVGQEAVQVWNPTAGTGCLSVCSTKANGRTIQAAILSVAHTFTVQNYATIGDRGELKILGSIAQKFRGAVGTAGDQGYDKRYKYDTRFLNTAPPKFLAPASTTYGVSTWSEINPVYNADGTYK